MIDIMKYLSLLAVMILIGCTSAPNLPLLIQLWLLNLLRPASQPNTVTASYVTVCPMNMSVVRYFMTAFISKRPVCGLTLK